jgi:hypothetical protein
VAKFCSTTEIFTPPISLQKQLETNNPGIRGTQITSVGNPPEILAGLQPLAVSDVYMMGAIMYYIFNKGKIPPKPLEMKDYTLTLPAEISQLSPELGHYIQNMTCFEPNYRPHDFFVVETRIIDIIQKLET